MRIHLFTLRLKEHGGGSHQNVMLFVRFLKSVGHTVVFHTMFADGNEPPPDITIQRERGEGRSFIALQKLCAEAMMRAEENADVFFIYGQALLWAVGLYRKAGGTVPAAVYLDSHLDAMKEAYRTTGVLHRIRHALWIKLRGLSLARHVDRFLAVSPYLVERYVAYRLPKEKFAIVPNAFNLSPSAERISHDPPVILFVGRLSFEKGPDILVEALKHLLQERWRVRIVGDGPMRSELEAAMRAAREAGRAEIAGWKNPSELAREYAAADIFVLPSRVPEPFGRTVVEAMHAGLPVIVPEKGGAVWVAGDAGILFNNGDADSLSSAIATLLRSPERRRVLSRRGAARAASFCVEAVGPMLARELEVLARAR